MKDNLQNNKNKIGRRYGSSGEAPTLSAKAVSSNPSQNKKNSAKHI
jgi:hypothetical protein